jgi:hypothetical protein
MAIAAPSPHNPSNSTDKLGGSREGQMYFFDKDTGISPISAIF